AARALLHIKTPLEGLIEARVAEGRDVVLTGNPGDGKSHLIRVLQERGALRGASVEPDLSARATPEVVAAWTAARAAKRPFVLGANEGPLVDLLEALVQAPSLSSARDELGAQLRRLLVHR